VIADSRTLNLRPGPGDAIWSPALPPDEHHADAEEEHVGEDHVAPEEAEVLPELHRAPALVTERDEELPDVRRDAAVRLPDDGQARVSIGKAPQVIPGAVVHDDQLGHAGSLAERALYRFWQIACLVEAWNDHGDGSRIAETWSRHRCPAPTGAADGRCLQVEGMKKRPAAGAPPDT